MERILANEETQDLIGEYLRRKGMPLTVSNYNRVRESTPIDDLEAWLATTGALPRQRTQAAPVASVAEQIMSQIPEMAQSTPPPPAPSAAPRVIARGRSSTQLPAPPTSPPQVAATPPSPPPTPTPTPSRPPQDTGGNRNVPMAAGAFGIATLLGLLLGKRFIRPGQSAKVASAVLGDMPTPPPAATAAAAGAVTEPPVVTEAVRIGNKLPGAANDIPTAAVTAAEPPIVDDVVKLGDKLPGAANDPNLTKGIKFTDDVLRTLGFSEEEILTGAIKPKQIVARINTAANAAGVTPQEYLKGLKEGKPPPAKPMKKLDEVPEPTDAELAQEAAGTTATPGRPAGTVDDLITRQRATTHAVGKGAQDGASAQVEQALADSRKLSEVAQDQSEARSLVKWYYDKVLGSAKANKPLTGITQTYRDLVLDPLKVPVYDAEQALIGNPEALEVLKMIQSGDELGNELIPLINQAMQKAGDFSVAQRVGMSSDAVKSRLLGRQAPPAPPPPPTATPPKKTAPPPKAAPKETAPITERDVFETPEKPKNVNALKPKKPRLSGKTEVGARMEQRAKDAATIPPEEAPIEGGLKDALAKAESKDYAASVGTPTKTEQARQEAEKLLSTPVGQRKRGRPPGAKNKPKETAAAPTPPEAPKPPATASKSDTVAPPVSGENVAGWSPYQTKWIYDKLTAGGPNYQKIQRVLSKHGVPGNTLQEQYINLLRRKYSEAMSEALHVTGSGAAKRAELEKEAEMKAARVKQVIQAAKDAGESIPTGRKYAAWLQDKLSK